MKRITTVLIILLALSQILSAYSRTWNSEKGFRSSYLENDMEESFELKSVKDGYEVTYRLLKSGKEIDSYKGTGRLDNLTLTVTAPFSAKFTGYLGTVRLTVAGEEHVLIYDGSAYTDGKVTLKLEDGSFILEAETLKAKGSVRWGRLVGQQVRTYRDFMLFGSVLYIGDLMYE